MNHSLLASSLLKWQVTFEAVDKSKLCGSHCSNLKIICKESLAMVLFRALLPAHLQVCMGAPWTGATLG